MTKTKTYKLKPTNTVEGINKHFDWVYSWITVEHCPLKPQTEEKEIELINFGKYVTTENALNKFDEMGYEAAPSNYLLSLGIEHPEVIKEKGLVVSLDESNLLPSEDGDLCFLSLDWDGKRDLRLTTQEGEWGDFWWFAVVRKSLHSETVNPDSLKNLTLDSAIKLVKENGYRIFKEL